MESEGKAGPVIATVVVVVLLIVGAFYLMKQPATTSQTPGEQVNSTSTPPATVADDVDTLEADLNALNVSATDTSMSDLEKELKAQ